MTDHEESSESEETLPVVKTRSDVKELTDEGGSFIEQLGAIDVVIHPGNTFLGSLTDTSLSSAENVFDHLTGRQKSYDPGEEDPYPGSLRPSVPWPGRRLDIWTDGTIMLFGRAADQAFRDTKERCLRLSRRQSSPYLKSELSKEAAEKVERERIKEQKQRALPDFEFALPNGKGELVRRLGYTCQTTHTGDLDTVGVLFDEEYEGRPLTVSKEKLDLCLKYVRTVSPAAERKGELEFRQYGDDWSNPIQVHLRNHSLREETIEKIKAEYSEVVVPPTTLVGMVMPIGPVGINQKAVWHRLPKKIKLPEVQGTGETGEESEEDTGSSNQEDPDSLGDSAETDGYQGALFE